MKQQLCIWKQTDTVVDQIDKKPRITALVRVAIKQLIKKKLH